MISIYLGKILNKKNTSHSINRPMPTFVDHPGATFFADLCENFPFIKQNTRRTIVTERRETALKDIDNRMAGT